MTSVTRTESERPAGVPGLGDLSGVSDEVAESALLIGTLYRWVLSHGDSGASLRVVDEYGLSFLEFRALLELLPGPKAPGVQDVAAAAGSSVSAMSRAIDHLVGKGLVSRAEDPDDRRRRMLALTDDGRLVVNRILMGRAVGVVQLASELAPEERTSLKEAMARLIQREDFARIHRQIREAVDR